MFYFKLVAYANKVYRDSQLLKSKISGNAFMLHSVRSLDDAIDLASR